MTATADSQVLPEWIAAAECTRVDPETFFPIGRDSALAEPAKAICRRCAAIRECLAYALVVDVQGVWGGTSDSERAALRLRHGIVSEPISLNLPVSLFDSATAIDDRGGGASLSQIADQTGVSSRTVSRYRAARRAGTTVRPIQRSGDRT